MKVVLRILIIFFVLNLLPSLVLAGTLEISWNASTGATGYEVCWDTSKQNVLNWTGNVVDVGSDLSLSVYFETPPRIIYVSVIAYNENERTLAAECIGYYLHGDINDTFNEGATASTVNSQDSSILSVYFGEDASANQSCDLNKDGVINGIDLMEMGSAFGNEANIQ